MEKRLTTQEVKDIYGGVSDVTLWRWKTDLNMPYRKIGRECYFLESQLEQWEKQFAQEINIPELLSPNRPSSIIKTMGVTASQRRSHG